MVTYSRIKVHIPIWKVQYSIIVNEFKLLQNPLIKHVVPKKYFFLRYSKKSETNMNFWNKQDD